MMPVSRSPQRSPLKAVLLALVAVTVAALVGLVIASQASQPAEVAYQNDDYQVPPADLQPPPLPVPETYAEARDLVTDNPLYKSVVPNPVRCSAQPINVATATDPQLASHFDSLMECIVRVWQPPVEQAGFTIVRPSVTVYANSITTRCGDAKVNAFYCAADQQVYYSNRLPEAIPIVRDNKWGADVVMGHEFGHALQARTAILVSGKALGQNSGDERADLEYSRRLETQADCLSGMFIRSVAVSLGIQQEDTAGIQDTFTAIGDDTLSGDPDIEADHGLAVSRRFWGTTGLANFEVGKCNTFIADASLVR